MYTYTCIICSIRSLDIINHRFHSRHYCMNSQNFLSINEPESQIKTQRAILQACNQGLLYRIHLLIVGISDKMVFLQLLLPDHLAMFIRCFTCMACV